MLVKIHKNSNGKILVSLCDEALIGKKYEEKKFQLDLSGNFYRGEKLNDAETKRKLQSAYIINVVGEKSIEYCLKERLIDKKNIIRIKNVPHAQAILLS